MNKLSKDIEKINRGKKALTYLFQTACFLVLITILLFLISDTYYYLITAGVGALCYIAAILIACKSDKYIRNLKKNNKKLEVREETHLMTFLPEDAEFFEVIDDSAWEDMQAFFESPWLWKNVVFISERQCKIEHSMLAKDTFETLFQYK